MGFSLDIWSVPVYAIIGLKDIPTLLRRKEESISEKRKPNYGGSALDVHVTVNHVITVPVSVGIVGPLTLEISQCINVINITAKIYDNICIFSGTRKLIVAHSVRITYMSEQSIVGNLKKCS